MSDNIFNDAFKALEALNEDAFNANQKGLEELKVFLDDGEKDKENDTFTIIDSEAETYDNIKKSYIGDGIIQCDICKSFIYKPIDEIIVDEETGIANIEDECPYCHTVDDGFTIIGKVAPFKEDKIDIEIKDNNQENKEDDKDEKEDKEEEVKIKESYEDKDLELIDKRKRDYINDEDDCDLDECDLKEDLGSDISEYQKWVDYDMKKYGYISAKTYNDIRKAGLSITKDQYGDYEVIASEPIHESLDNISLDTGDQVIDVKTKPISKSEEMIAPLDDTDIEEIEDNSMEENEIEEKSTEDEEIEDEVKEENIEYIDENELNTQVESYLINKYSNIKSYITESIRSKGNTLIIEGTIRFKNNHTKQTSFIFEAKNIDDKHNIIFEGYNTHIGTQFSLKGRAINETLNKIKLQEKHK